MAIVDQGEPCRLAAAILCAEAEAGDLVLVGFVELGEALAQFVFADVGAVGVEDIAGECSVEEQAWRVEKGRL